MIKEEKLSLKQKAKRFWNNHSESIIQLGLGVLIIGAVSGVAYSNSRSVGKKIDTKLGNKCSEADTKYLGHNGLILSGAYRETPDDAPNEFISNGATLQSMGEFGEDVSALLNIPMDANMSAIHFVYDED